MMMARTERGREGERRMRGGKCLIIATCGVGSMEG